jgi:hypothetical protein
MNTAASWDVVKTPASCVTEIARSSYQLRTFRCLPENYPQSQPQAPARKLRLIQSKQITS